MQRFVVGLCHVFVTLAISISPALAVDPPATPSSAGTTATPAAKPEESKPAGAHEAKAPVVPKESAEKTTVDNTKERYFYFVVATVAAFVIIALLLLKSALRNGQWSVADALSEESACTATPAPVAPAAPVTATPQLIPSSSRLIAFIGMFVMVAMFLGIGLYVLYAAFFDHPGLAAIKDVGTSYFLPGSALFAPYAFNKVAEAFK